MAKLTNDDVIRLQDRVKRAALVIATQKGFSIEPDEVEQMIWLAIIEKAEVIDDLLDQKDAYIVAAGEYSVRSQLWKHVYRSQFSRAAIADRSALWQSCQSMPNADVDDEMSDEVWEWLQTTIVDQPMIGETPDVESGSSLLGSMESLFEGLEPVYRFVAEGLLAGLQKQEIATALPQAGFESRTPAWVGWFCRKKLAPVVQSWLAA